MDALNFNDGEFDPVAIVSNSLMNSNNLAVNSPTSLANHLNRLHQFLNRLATCQTLLSIDPNVASLRELTDWRWKELMHLPHYVEVVRALPDRYHYTPYLNVFLSSCKAMTWLNEGIDWPTLLGAPEQRYACLNGMSLIQAYAQFITLVQYRCQSDDVRDAVYRLHYESLKRCNEYCDYIDALWDRCCRLIVIRLDLFYEKTIAHTVTLEDANRDVTQLLRSTPYASVFAGLKGYVVKTEFGIEKGIHCHATFFLDGSVRNPSSHIHHAQLIGEFWNKNITKGQGEYWNVNAQIKDFERLGTCGIGAIAWDDYERRRHVKQYVIQYACKPEQVVKLNCGKRLRSIRRGNSPDMRPHPLGRPRQKDGGAIRI